MSKKQTRSVARTANINIGTMFGRQILPLLAVVLGIWLFREKIPHIDPTRVWETIHQVSPHQWGLASAATIASFWAIGRYDQVLHGLLGTGISPAQARYSGRAAIAVAQFAGFGVLSSALIRWRLLPDLSLGRALGVSMAVSVSFLLGWAIVTASTVLIAGLGEYYLRQVSLVVLLLGTLIAGVLILQPRLFGQLPPLRAFLTILFFAFADSLFTGLALYVLFPPDLTLNPVLFFAVFLISLGAGLIGATPGGVGPFELTLLTLLPLVPVDTLLASALAFRIVYYVIPALLGLLVLLNGPLKRAKAPCSVLSPPSPRPFLTPKLETTLWSATRSELNLIRQGEFRLLSQNEQPQLIAATVGQSLMMIADPLSSSAPTGPIINSLQAQARQLLRAPLIYKCSEETAQATRELGWKSLPVALEALINPTQFSTEGSKHRQLRRYLRKSSNAGVRVIEGARKLPLTEMAQVSAAWSKNHGGERGFSMGRFDPDYVSCQRVFLAYNGDELLGFITLHETRNEWSLDLMRQRTGTPEGTMHLLVTHAIQSAAAIQCPRFSLAAIPHPGGNDTPAVSSIRRHLLRTNNTDGLRRFKESFAPKWQPLYACAPSTISLGLGLLAVFLRVNNTSKAATAPKFMKFMTNLKLPPRAIHGK